MKIIIPHKNRIADLSTGHITREDASRLENDVVPGRIGSTRYGWIVDTTIASEELSAHGMSPAYIALMHLLRRRKFYYAFLDQDADQVEGIPTFDW